MLPLPEIFEPAYYRHPFVLYMMLATSQTPHFQWVPYPTEDHQKVVRCPRPARPHPEHLQAVSPANPGPLLQKMLCFRLLILLFQDRSVCLPLMPPRADIRYDAIVDSTIRTAPAKSRLLRGGSNGVRGLGGGDAVRAPCITPRMRRGPWACGRPRGGRRPAGRSVPSHPGSALRAGRHRGRSRPIGCRCADGAARSRGCRRA